jgi:hypothetical protein
VTPVHILLRAAARIPGGGVFLSACHLAAAPLLSLHPTLDRSPLHAADSGSLTISGTAPSPQPCTVSVTLSTTGTSVSASVTPADGRFSLTYPGSFPGAPPLTPSLLYIDALTAASAIPDAEITVVITGSHPPDLPLAFCDDFIDSHGRKDRDAAQFPLHRALANRFLQSRAAHLMGIHQPDFDLATEDDWQWFRDHAALYDFDHRDRNWSTPLGHRRSRGFWQAVWNRWFNPTNNHPWDGNPQNRRPDNFRPYTFTNDTADLAVLYCLLQQARPSAPDHRSGLLREVISNLLASQHTSAENFALPDAEGRREHYTAGAFRYGMFESGEWLTEGKGWFSRPEFRDFAHGGVFNGRAVWALGEMLHANPHDALAPAIQQAIALALRFCLHDGLAHGYTSLTGSGLPFWKHPGEHAYLTLGLIPAALTFPDFPISLNPAAAPQRLAGLAAKALDALAETSAPDGTWTHYANVNAIHIAALAQGCLSFPQHPRQPAWLAAARKAADLWLNLTASEPDAAAFPALFGDRKGSRMTFQHGPGPTHANLYASGHWLHALALLSRATDHPAARQRALAITATFLGHNALQTRLLSAIGSIHNRITAPASPDLLPRLAWDAYPESTAFFQIGLLHLLIPPATASH